MRAPKVSAVDIFCGAGGLTHGLLKSGITVAAGFDVDESCRYAYEHNNKPAKFLAVDVTALSAEHLLPHFQTNGIKLLAGCAPCQPFSTYSLGKTKSTDSKWTLLSEFLRLVIETKPEIVTMENVPKLLKHDVYKIFRRTLLKHGYQISDQVVDCIKYGIPQSRKRLVLLASLFGPIRLRERDPLRDKRRTVRHVIGRLPPLEAGDISENDSLHRTSSMDTTNLRRIMASKPGGSWKDWNDDLISGCHKLESGSTFVGVYGRMVWDAPSPTITTQFYGYGNGRFGHPEQNRALSLREGALLQTFPREYRFIPPNKQIHMTSVGRMIGNAVPVRLGQIIGESIKQHILSYV